jgi:DNA-binding IclR family transcriptional regulator
VRARSGDVVAAINVAIPWSPIAMSEVAARLGPTLQATANEISARVV